MEFSSTTGRFVVDYFINDDSMMYASISKGFKGGGINPAVDPVVFPNVQLDFPETNFVMKLAVVGMTNIKSAHLDNEMWSISASLSLSNKSK